MMTMMLLLLPLPVKTVQISMSAETPQIRAFDLQTLPGECPRLGFPFLNQHMRRVLLYRPMCLLEDPLANLEATHTFRRAVIRHSHCDQANKRLVDSIKDSHLEIP